MTGVDNRANTIFFGIRVLAVCANLAMFHMRFTSKQHDPRNVLFVNKQRIIAVITFLFSSLIPTLAHPNKVLAVMSSGVYTITPVDGVGNIFGCIGSNCPVEKRKVVALREQTRYPALASASKIVTVMPFTGDPTTTGCAIVKGTLNCFGTNKYGRIGDESSSETSTAFVTATENGKPMVDVTDVAVTRETTCVIQQKVIRCIGRLDSTPETSPGQPMKESPTWLSIQSPEPSKIRVFSQNKAPGIGGPFYGLPYICALFVDGRLGCTWVSKTPDWRYFATVGIRDFDMSNSPESSSKTVCIAGDTSGCFTISGATFGELTEIPNTKDSDVVFYQFNVILFYKGGSLWAAPQRASGILPAHLVGYMQKPIAMLFQGSLGSSGINEQLLVTSDGLLSVPTTALSCDNCFTNAQGALSPMTTFEESDKSRFNFVSSVNGSTDTLEYLPLSVVSGVRSSVVRRTLRVVSQSGEAISNAIVKWGSTDVPAGLPTTIESTVTDANGNFKVEAVEGPVTFAVSNGAVSSGAILQGASVTLLYSSGGNTEVTIPDPAPIIDRRVTVLDIGGRPVANAQIRIRNSYLAFTYSFRGANTATWGAQPPDAKGFVGRPHCLWCFVPPPAFITGIDGSVSFRSFETVSRSMPFDADVIYDDGVLNVSLEHIFQTTDDTVTFPSSPTLAVTSSSSASTSSVLNMNADGSGNVTIDVAATQSDPGSASKPKVEDVCEDMETGAVWNPALNVNDLCSSRRSTVTRSGINCNAGSLAQSDRGATTSITLCSTKSRLIRIRSVGALPAQAICIVVKNQPCSRKTKVLGAEPRTRAIRKVVGRGSRVSLRNAISTNSGTKVAYSTTGPCEISRNIMIMPRNVAACIVTTRQVATAKNPNAKSTVTQTVFVSK